MISMMDYACMCSIDAYVHKASSRNINLQCHQRSQRYVEFLSPSLPPCKFQSQIERESFDKNGAVFYNANNY